VYYLLGCHTVEFGSLLTFRKNVKNVRETGASKCADRLEEGISETGGVSHCGHVSKGGKTVATH
jgi:hypothetical protein